MDELAWKAIFIGWSPPTKEEELGKEVPMSELEWSTEEDTQSSNN